MRWYQKLLCRLGIHAPGTCYKTLTYAGVATTYHCPWCGQVSNEKLPSMRF